MGNVRLKDKLMFTPTSIRLTERQLDYCAEMDENGEVSAHIRKLIDKDMRFSEVLGRLLATQKNESKSGEDPAK